MHGYTHGKASYLRRLRHAADNPGPGAASPVGPGRPIRGG